MSDVYVLAGTNGAGKSSIAGAMLEYSGAEYFNPDRAARQLLLKNPGVTQQTANSAAWHEGRRLLERTIRERYDRSRLNLIRLLPILAEQDRS